MPEVGAWNEVSMLNSRPWANLPAVSAHFSESVKSGRTSSTSMSAIL
jgi:hypothetical protein